MIIFHTNLGDITIELNDDKAPVTCENFKQYVRDGHFDGTIFHRVIDNFMIQGGGFTEDMTEKPSRAPIENEAKKGINNERGAIAMARTSDPHSATAQFFINVKDNPFLDHPGQDGWGYCAFGKVAEGMDVVDRIRAVETTNRAGHSDVPVEPIVIEKAEIAERQA